MTAPTLRDRLAKALRGKYDSTDARPSYRAADAVLPVVEAWAAEQSKHVQQQRDSLLADLKELERTVADIQQACRTATIPPVGEQEARLARRILGRIEQPTGADAAAPTLRQRAEQAEAAIQRVRDLHHDENGSCSACMDAAESSVASPCTTITALDQPEDS